MASRVRTSDESPLTADDVALVRQFFANVGHREFWIVSLVLFLKYYLFDRVHPNQDRYWKRILSETRKVSGGGSLSVSWIGCSPGFQAFAGGPGIW